MRLFISEWITSGAWEEPHVPASLLREGTAMLVAMATDLGRIPDCKVSTTWDRRWGECPLTLTEGPPIEVRIVENAEQENRRFEELCREADAVLIIAPEFDDILADRCRLVEELGAESLNCSVESIRLCADKLELARRLESLKIPTIPTREIDLSREILESDLEFPLVVKPRDGAGCLETYLLRKAADWQHFQKVKRQESRDKDRKDWTGPTSWIVQPYLDGRTLSIAAIVGGEQWNGEPWLEVFPLAEQDVIEQGPFRYRGGRIPQTSFLQHEATHLVRKIARQIPGLSGYIGIDLIAPFRTAEEVVVVEINPRLTTSYLGYRELADQNPAEYLIPSRCPEEPLRWKPHAVDFTPDGQITISKPRAR